MAEIICIIGNKGGTGKTTLSHLLSHGLNLLGRKAACVLTDEDREPLSPSGRRYVIADARSGEAREKVVATLQALPGWLGVLDGGANRTERDIDLYQCSDVVLLPFRDSAEDLRTVIRDLELLPRAYALPSQWPHNKWAREAATRLLEQKLPAPFHERVLKPVFSVAASKLLLQTEVPTSLPSGLNAAARQVAQQVLRLIENDDEQVSLALQQAAASVTPCVE